MRTLEREGYEVNRVSVGAEAVSFAVGEGPAVVILDLGLPDMDGTEVIAGLRGWTAVPILVLSGRTDSADKVDALDAGADDYVIKPFAADELLARIRALTRRAVATGEDAPVVRFGDVSVDLGAKIAVARRDGADTPVRLTPTEWQILDLLLRNPRKLITQRSILTDIRGPQHVGDSGYLRLYIAQLRKKLDPDPSRPRYILTEPGMGYRFQPDAE